MEYIIPYYYIDLHYEHFKTSRYIFVTKGYVGGQGVGEEKVAKACVNQVEPASAPVTASWFVYLGTSVQAIKRKSTYQNLEL